MSRGLDRASGPAAMRGLVAAALHQREGRVARADAAQAGRTNRSARSATTWITSPSRCSRPRQRDHRARTAQPPLPLEQAGPDDQVGDAGLVLQGDEQHAPRRARLLPHQHDARHGQARPSRVRASSAHGDDAARRQLVAQERHRMAAQRQAEAARNPPPPRAPPSSAARRPPAPASRSRSNSGSRASDRPPIGPERAAAIKPEGREPVRLGNPLQRRGRHAGAPPRLERVAKRRVPRRDQRAPRPGWRGPSPCAARAARPEYRPPVVLQRAIPAAGVDADRAHLARHARARRAPPAPGRRTPSAGCSAGPRRTRPGGGISSTSWHRRSARSSRRGFRESRSCRNPRSGEKVRSANARS